MMRKKNIFNRPKITVMAICCLLLSACANSPIASIPEAIAKKNWTGHPVTEAIAKWGKSVPKPVGDGTTVYEWAMGGNYAQTKYVPTTEHNMFGDMLSSKRETEVVNKQCTLTITADANGIITNFETNRSSGGAGGCSEFYYGSDSVSPDAASAAKGKMLVENMDKARKLNDSYEMICNNPEYAALFKDMHCDDSQPFSVASDVKLAKITPKQQELFAKWRAEMDSVVMAYQVFLRGTQSPIDKGMADGVDTGNAAVKPYYEKNKFPLAFEHLSARNAQVLSAYVRRTYLP
jgi:hypothetical protein